MCKNVINEKNQRCCKGIAINNCKNVNNKDISKLINDETNDESLTDKTLYRTTTGTNSDIHIFHLNIRSLRKHFNELEILVEHWNYDICVLTETFL